MPLKRFVPATQDELAEEDREDTRQRRPRPGRDEQRSPFAAPGEPEREYGEAGGPVIEVTIGRVEVRAVRPSEPPRPAPKPAAPAPRLSLEEYLRGQRGGRA